MSSKKNKKTILVVHPTRYDEHSLLRDQILKKYNLIWFHESVVPEEQIYGKNVGPLTVNVDPEILLQRLRTLADEHNIDGIMSSQDYPGNILASIIAQERNLWAPDPVLVTGFQHKIYSRTLQQLHVPEATPHFCPIHVNDIAQKSTTLSFPLFTKPAKASFSIYAHRVANATELANVLTSCQLPQPFTQLFDWYVNKVGISTVSADHYVAEKLLEGVQVTLEGFVFNGHVTIVGIVDSIMHPGTICFERFVYPSQLPQKVQERMQQATITLMKGVGYNNGFFNMEFMYNPTTEQIGIIEVNPRMASQFADLYEMVDGHNTYHHLAAIASNKLPTVLQRKGNFKTAASCVLRIFENKKVIAVPTQQQIELIKKQIPESSVFLKISKGQSLLDIEQDGKSYAYAVIQLGGGDRQQIDEKLLFCKKHLNFEFANIT